MRKDIFLTYASRPVLFSSSRNYITLSLAHSVSLSLSFLSALSVTYLSLIFASFFGKIFQNILEEGELKRDHLRSGPREILPSDHRKHFLTQDAIESIGGKGKWRVSLGVHIPHVVFLENFLRRRVVDVVDLERLRDVRATCA